jgi:hypothetical protein
MLPLSAGGKDDAAVLDIHLQAIAGADIKAAAQRTRKNDLASGGKLGLHGKAILP